MLPYRLHSVLTTHRLAHLCRQCVASLDVKLAHITISVVYFHQCLGAAQSKCWSKFYFFMFSCKKAEKRKKMEAKFSINKKSRFDVPQSIFITDLVKKIIQFLLAI